VSEQPYVAITADTHAGASIDAYRAYLDPDKRSEFDAWRGHYKNPSEKHVGGKKTKNWDSNERRIDLQADGVVGEVIFPNTVPPFYDRAFHVAPPPSPDQYPRYLAGTRAHNRWLAEFCAEEPARRAGIGLIHLNDIDDAIEDVRWIASHGLRGGVLLPLPAPSDVHLRPLNHPDYDRLWAVIQDCDVVMNQHSGQGSPAYCDGQGSKALWAMEMSFFVQRGYTHLIMGGVFERFPKLRYILTESGAAWAPSDASMDAMSRLEGGRDRRDRHLEGFASGCRPTPSACWYGASFLTRRHPGTRDRGRPGAWARLPLRGLLPYSRENMRFAFSDVAEAEVRKMVGENAAALYRFDLASLRPAAQEAGITPSLVAQPLEEIPADSTCITFQQARFEKLRKKRQA
jgi:predicted TIM-barrel fold metal-dependent hydrolase